MITKGYITKILNTNKYQVRVPIFEKAGVNTHSLFDATLCYSPGNLNHYSIGDCVFIGFEDNLNSRPIILGKLYLGNETKPTNYGYMHSLKVEHNAELPQNTKIGEIQFNKISNLVQLCNNLQDYIDNVGLVRKKEEYNGIETLELDYKVYYILTQSKSFTLSLKECESYLVPEYKLKINATDNLTVYFPLKLVVISNDLSQLSVGEENSSTVISFTKNGVYYITIQDNLCRIDVLNNYN